MAIVGRISFEDVPRERIVTLPNVESFDLTVSDGGRGYQLTAQISCPSATYTSLMHTVHCYTVPEEIFPASASWNAIVHQYAKSPVEEVTLELKIALAIVCKLNFRSTDGTVIELCFRVVEDDNGFCLPSQEMQNEILTQSTRSVQCHPQLANVKRLRMCHSFRFICSPEDWHIANEIGRLFRSVGPLDELTIYRCDLRPYHRPSLNPRGDRVDETVVFPPTKQLTISHPNLHSSDEQFKVTMVGIAKSQHRLGIPFERVVIRKETMPVGMEKGLGPWVGSVEHRYEKPCESDD